MQQPQPVCKRCGLEHSAPYKSMRSASALNQTNPEEITMTKKYIMIMFLKMVGLCTISNWCIDKASLVKKEVEMLSSFAHHQGLHDLFPAKDNIKKLIAQLEWVCENLKDDEEKTIQDILQGQICALKIIECKVYSMTDGMVNDTESEDAIEQDDHEEDDGKGILMTKEAEHGTESTPIHLKIKAEKNSAMEAVDCQPDVPGNPNTTNHATGTDNKDVTKSLSFDVRYHYRRANKCARCASSDKGRGEKDCFFPLVFYRKTLDKCINCRHSGCECEFLITDNDSIDHLVSAEQSPKPRYSDHREPPTPPTAQSPIITTPSLATALSTSALPTPAAALLPSTAPTLVATPSVPPQVVPAAVSVADPMPTAIVGNGKRRALSELRRSSPTKHRRTHDGAHQPVTEFVSGDYLIDKATVLRQVTCLNISLESFTDMSLRRIASDRKHREQEAVFEKHKEAYEQSQQVFEERKRAYDKSMKVLEEKKQAFEDSKRLCGENKPIYMATQECLATRVESAGENIIEEANNLLSSIERHKSPQEIAPAIQHLRTVFDDFIHVQGELAEEHKFRGDRARLLYILMERIHEAVRIEVLVEDAGPDESSRCY